MEILILCFILVPGSLMVNPAISIQDLNGQEPNDFLEDSVWRRLEDYALYSPLTPGSANHDAFIDYADDLLQNYSWMTVKQQWIHATPAINLTNLIAIKRGVNATSDASIILLGAHYDARLRADKDPNPLNRILPVPGINDGGSGVAILLELARVLEVPSDYEIWIVLFDAEDQGGIPGWAGGLNGWCIGSSHFVSQLNASTIERLKLAVIIDLVGSPNLRLTREGSSNIVFSTAIWRVAQDLGFNSTFLDQTGGSIIDDHKPFLDAGIPAVDIIQLQDSEGYLFFKWHHTTNDTLENTDAESLYMVGVTVETYLESLPNTLPSGVDAPPLDPLSTSLVIALGGIALYVLISLRRAQKPYLKITPQTQ